MLPTYPLFDSVADIDTKELQLQAAGFTVIG